MFVRKKLNKSGLISVQVIDKSSGRYRVIKTIGSSKEEVEVQALVKLGKEFIYEITGTLELDFTDYSSTYTQVLTHIHEHKLVGIDAVLGKIFDEIGFNQISDPLFKDLVLYRLVYPVSKLKTTQFLQRYEQKNYSDDEVYRYMDKLEASQKQRVQQLSYEHSLHLLGGQIQAVFYDVTTLYFEIEREDAFRKTGFSKDGKHQHPQLILGLLVSQHAYPLAYDVFEGNTFEGDTIMPVLERFEQTYGFSHLTVVADSGLLSAKNIEALTKEGYTFILGARIKNERKDIKEQILQLKPREQEPAILIKDGLRLVVTYSANRAAKDAHNRQRGLAQLQKKVHSGKLTKSNINNKGYNKFLKLDGYIRVEIDQQKIQDDSHWDGLKGYITNSTVPVEQILENYSQLWQIEKAFRVAKSELKIRPVFHYKQRRIQAHICLNFVAYKVYKELERQLKAKKSPLSPERVIEIIQTIYQVSVRTPENQLIKHTLLLSDEQRHIQQLFNF